MDIKLWYKYQFWILLVVLILFLTLPSWFFPLYYLDENIYLAIGDRLAKGDILYRDVWDHKPPMLYLVYAFSNWLFGATITPLKILNSVLIFVSGLSLYKIYLILTDKSKYSKALVIIFILIWGLMFEGVIVNGENIFVPLILFGFWQGLKWINTMDATTPYKYLYFLLSVVSLGLATLVKVHAVIEVALLTVFLISYYIHNRPTKNLEKSFYLGFVSFIFTLSLPWAITIGYFYQLGYFDQFWFAVFGYNQSYVDSSRQVSYWLFDFSWLQLQVLIWVFSTGVALFYLYLKKISLNQCFIWIWFFTTWFLALLPGRAYPHYILQALPASIVLATCLTSKPFAISKIPYKTMSRIYIIYIFWYFLLFFGPLSYINYPHYYSFYIRPFLYTDFNSWQINTPLSDVKGQNQLIELIQSKTNPEDKIFILWDQPQLYALSDTKPADARLVSFHLNEVNTDQFITNLDSQSPQLIIVQNDQNKASRLNSHYSMTENYSPVNLSQYPLLETKDLQIWIKNSN